jgi:hypothetical protein
MRAMNDAWSAFKPWVKDIFASKQEEDLLRKKAHDVLDGAIAAARLPGSPNLNREWLASQIGFIIRERRISALSAPKGQLTKYAAHAKKISKRTSKLVADLRHPWIELSGLAASSDAMPLPWNAEIPSWKALARGLARLEQQAQSLAFYYRSLHPEGGTGRIIRDWIVPLYENSFNKEARKSRGSKNGKLQGPFIRFAQHVERETNPFLEAPGVHPETIASVLRERKEALKDKNIGLDRAKK